jgi:hypothetical protein
MRIKTFGLWLLSSFVAGAMVCTNIMWPPGTLCLSNTIGLAATNMMLSQVGAGGSRMYTTGISHVNPHMRFYDTETGSLTNVNSFDIATNINPDWYWEGYITNKFTSDVGVGTGAFGIPVQRNEIPYYGLSFDIGWLPFNIDPSTFSCPHDTSWFGEVVASNPSDWANGGPPGVGCTAGYEVYAITSFTMWYTNGTPDVDYWYPVWTTNLVNPMVYIYPPVDTIGAANLAPQLDDIIDYVGPITNNGVQRISDFGGVDFSGYSLGIGVGSTADFSQIAYIFTAKVVYGAYSSGCGYYYNGAPDDTIGIEWTDRILPMAGDLEILSWGENTAESEVSAPNWASFPNPRPGYRAAMMGVKILGPTNDFKPAPGE